MKNFLFSMGTMLFNLLPDPTEQLKSELSNKEKTKIVTYSLIALPFAYLFMVFISIIQ